MYNDGPAGSLSPSLQEKNLQHFISQILISNLHQIKLNLHQTILNLHQIELNLHQIELNLHQIKLNLQKTCEMILIPN